MKRERERLQKRKAIKTINEKNTMNGKLDKA
jgi:hypothetical protein